MGLYGALPTFAELFNTIDGSADAGFNTDTAYGLQGKMLSDYISSVGDSWYVFFSVGSSLEIARVKRTGNTASSYQKTRLNLSAVNENSKQTFSLNYNSPRSDNTLYSGVYIYLHFDETYPIATIDEVFSAATVTSPKYYYGSTEQSSHPLQKSSTADYTGACLVAFCGATSANAAGAYQSDNWSISDWSAPLVPIYSCKDNNVIDRTVIKERVVSSVPSYTPTITGGDESVYTRSYSLFRLQETW